MKFHVVLASILLCGSGFAYAQSEDPVDKNTGGGFVGAQVVVGEAFKVGDSSPGTAFLVGIDGGYTVRRDTWGRIEFGLELDTGKATYKDKDNDYRADLDLDLVAMVKAGYGYSLGNHVFGVLRVGVGVAQASLDAKPVGAAKIDGGKSSGVASMIAWDAVFPANDALDFNIGVSFRMIQFNFDDLPNDTGSFQVNIPAVYAGARLKL